MLSRVCNAGPVAEPSESVHAGLLPAPESMWLTPLHAWPVAVCRTAEHVGDLAPEDELKAAWERLLAFLKKNLQ